MTFPHRSLARHLSTAAAVLVCAACAGPAEGAAATTHHSEPFVSADVEPAASGGWTVSWTATDVRSVTVYAGPNAHDTKQLVGHASGDGLITVTDAPGVAQPWFRLVANDGASIMVAARDLDLASDPNFRDLGGYRTTDGQWVKMGEIYRSEAMTLSAADEAKVNTLGITAQYDLRTPGEIASAPDVVLAGSTVTNLNVVGVANASSAVPASVAAAQTELVDINKLFVTGAAAHKAYGTLFTDIANAHGPVSFNCTAGKDRTGWASAVILTLLGVPEPTVMQDYLLSNSYYLRSPSVQKVLREVPSSEVPALRATESVAPQYLDAGFAQVKKSYGSMYNYAIHGLRVSPQTIQRLRQRLLSDNPGA